MPRRSTIPLIDAHVTRAMAPAASFAAWAIVLCLILDQELEFVTGLRQKGMFVLAAQTAGAGIGLVMISSRSQPRFPENVVVAIRSIAKSHRAGATIALSYVRIGWLSGPLAFGAAASVYLIARGQWPITPWFWVWDAGELAVIACAAAAVMAQLIQPWGGYIGTVWGLSCGALLGAFEFDGFEMLYPTGLGWLAVAGALTGLDFLIGRSRGMRPRIRSRSTPGEAPAAGHLGH